MGPHRAAPGYVVRPDLRKIQQIVCMVALTALRFTFHLHGCVSW